MRGSALLFAASICLFNSVERLDSDSWFMLVWLIPPLFLLLHKAAAGAYLRPANDWDL